MSYAYIKSNKNNIKIMLKNKNNKQRQTITIKEVSTIKEIFVCITNETNIQLITE